MSRDRDRDRDHDHDRDRDRDCDRDRDYLALHIARIASLSKFFLVIALGLLPTHLSWPPTAGNKSTGIERIEGI